MSYEYNLLRVEVDGRLATVTVDAPPINVITLDLYRELVELSKELKADPELSRGYFALGLALEGKEPLDRSAVLDAYQQRRLLTRQEIDALPLMLRLGALRFWFSRLYDKVFPLSGELTFIKNPEFFRSLLHQRGKQRQALEALFLPHYVG